MVRAAVINCAITGARGYSYGTSIPTIGHLMTFTALTHRLPELKRSSRGG